MSWWFGPEGGREVLCCGRDSHFFSTETNLMISESALEHVLYFLDRIKKGQVDKLDDGGFTQSLAPIQQQFGSSHSLG